ncbi:MAG: dihydroorotase [Saprospiraceae bacterium]|nr:dihydroorotase [Saprospiraceae bacterium]
MSDFVIKNASIVNENKIFNADVWVRRGIIQKVDNNISLQHKADEIDASGLMLLPGIIDDQVHFREPGLDYKANIASESAAALAGGVTSFMEMPNTIPNTITQKLLQEKFDIAQKSSLANYSFFMGATNDNLEELLKTDKKNVCGIKIFMGSSTGNMLVDNQKALENIFKNVDHLIATHCEDEEMILLNTENYISKYGKVDNASFHPIIRNEMVCYSSSSKAIELAKKFNTRLHILHISTGLETNLFENLTPLDQKRITSEACVHHLYFNDRDYANLGNKIKCNPAIKTQFDSEKILEALLCDKIDIIATDHAPHTLAEKMKPYSESPSGLPLVQHSLNIMLLLHAQGKISLEKIVEKMCHAPAVCFKVENRGFIREGFFADLVLLDLKKHWKVTNENIHYKCGWSPLEGAEMTGQVTHTFVNGVLQYNNGRVFQKNAAQRLSFKA